MGKCPVEEYFDSLTNKQFEKISFVLDLIEQIDIVPRNYFKKLKGADEIWEVRVQQSNNIFRILGFWDGKNLVIHHQLNILQNNPICNLLQLLLK